MATWSEIDPKIQFAIVIGACLALVGGVYWMYLRPMQLANQNDKVAWQGKKAEIAQLQPYQAKVAQLNRDIDTLKQQIEAQRQVVPEEKTVDGFIRMVQKEGQTSGIEIRRFTSLPVTTREFYSELPFEMEIDGPYYRVLEFFDKLSKSDRIVNISGLSMANVKSPSQAKAKKTYAYAPTESVVATCLATTFFSPAPAPQPANGKPNGAPAGPKK